MGGKRKCLAQSILTTTLRLKPSSKKLPERIQSVTTVKNKAPRVFFQDEARFGRICQVRKTWLPKGERSEVKAQHIRQYLYAYSAIEPKTGESVSLIFPYANTACMTLFLKELSERYSDDELVLVLDGAAWHKSKELQIPSNIRLICLPPYSPQLNPVEQLWKGLRTKFFGNRYLETLDAVEAHLTKALQWVNKHTAWVKSFAYYPYIFYAI
ncbi:MAG: IS630 family transposase [Dolichospermum sp.]